MYRMCAWQVLAMAITLILPLPSIAQIKFAVVGGMSGQFGEAGTWFKRGARGAVEDINAAGGVMGQELEFTVHDDECDPDKAKQIAEELLASEVPFVMGHLCSDASIVASEIYAEGGVIAISPASTNPQLTERGLQGIFRTIGRDDMQGFVLAEHILRNFKTKKIGIVYDDTTYGRGVASVAKEFLNQAGVEEQFYEQAPPSPWDFSNLIDRIEEQRVRVLLYPAMPAQLASFLTQLRDRDGRVRLIGGDTFTNITLEGEDIALLDDVQFSFPPDPADDPRNEPIVERYKAEGFNPEAFTFYSYAAVQVWAMAVEEAGTVEADAVAKALKNQTFDTVLGSISFDDKGDITNPGFVMFYYDDGEKYYFE